MEMWDTFCTNGRLNEEETLNDDQLQYTPVELKNRNDQTRLSQVPGLIDYDTCTITYTARTHQIATNTCNYYTVGTPEIDSSSHRRNFSSGGRWYYQLACRSGFGD